jgi:hypothetical protein
MYSLTGTAFSHTVVAWKLEGVSLRRIRLGDPQEKGLPVETPEIADITKNAEFLIGQPVGVSGNSNRQLLACAFRWKGVKRGVVKLIRGTRTCPFTKCDAQLLSTLCTLYAPTPTRDAVDNSYEVERQTDDLMPCFGDGAMI